MELPPIEHALAGVVALLVTLAGTPLVVSLVRRWLDRPRLRVRVRSDGMYDGTDLVFEASNGGRRDTSLRPVVRVRGLEPFMSGRAWHPDFLLRLLGWNRAKAAYWHLYVPLQLRRVQGRVTASFDLEGEGEALRLVAHGGARTFTGNRRPPDVKFPFILFRTYSFWQEGRRRPTRVRLAVPGRGPLPAWRFSVARLWFRLTGRIPKSPSDLPSWMAEKQARG